MATLRISKKSSDIPLSTIFIDKYMCGANATFVKVYIYALRLSYDNSVNTFGLKDISNALGVLESDVVSAFKYWDSVGVVKFANADDGDFSLEFIELSEKTVAPKKADETAPAKEVTEKPTYTAKEIAIYIENNKGIKNMYELATKILGKPLSTNDTIILYSFYDWLRLPKDVILVLLEYCVSLGKTSMRYIEKVAISWADQEINTIRRANKFVNKQNERQSYLSNLKKILQIKDRDFSEYELKYIDEWTSTLKVSEEEVKKAYELTIINTSKLSFPYMNKILVSWSENGEKAPKSTKPVKKTQFNNYSSSSEISDFEKLMLKKRVEKTNKES